MTDRLLCMSRPFLDMYIIAIMRERGISLRDGDIDVIITQIQLTGNVTEAIGSFVPS